jgi:hypothetical protein
MKIVQKLIQTISDKLGLWILAIFGMLGSSVLFFCLDQVNLKILKLIEPIRLLVVIEWIILILCLLGAYILLLHYKSKKEMSELKTFLNKYVYANHEIKNPFTNEIPHTVNDHLSWKPFYEALENKKNKKT